MNKETNQQTEPITIPPGVGNKTDAGRE